MKQNTMHPRTAASLLSPASTLIAALMLLGAAHAQQPQRRHAAGPANKNAQAVDPAQAALEKKLDAIVIPVLEFKDTSIEEAVDFLRTKSKELDKSTADEAKKGLNFMVRVPRGFQVGRVTLNLKNVSLRKAIENVAEASGTQFKVDSFAVTFDPKETAAEPTTRVKSGTPEAAMVEAAKKIVIPEVNFEDVSLEEAVEFVNRQTKDLSDGEPAFTVKIDPSKVDGATRIKELRLKNVPVSETLKYLADATHTKITAGNKEIWVTRR